MQFDSLQSEALFQLKLNEDGNKIEVETPELFFYLSSIHPDVAELAFGKIGRNLIEFIHKIDLNHPDTLCVINSIFFNDLRLRQQVQEIIELVDKCKHLSSISVNFHKLVDRHLSKSFLDENFAIRILKSNQDRQLIRKKKTMQTIDLKTICGKGVEFWSRQPANFKIFNRYNFPYIEEIESHKEKADRYSDLGCSSIKIKLEDEIKQLKSAFRERYFGFNRITLSRAALILAKMHSYKFRTSWDKNDNKTSRIPDYEPRVYPFHALDASKEIIEVVEHLDTFPEINYKTLFDNYVVLVPGSKELIPYVHSILLGERDNKCYFICYFS